MDGKTELLKQLRIDRSTPPPARRTSVRILVVAGGVVVVLLGVWFTWSNRNSIEVQTATAQPAAAVQGSTAVLDASGYVTARRQATVSAKVTGRVAEVLIEEGQRVAAGQVLARLDATDANAQLNLARAQLDVARAQLADLHLLLAQAERDLARQQDLVARKLISQQSVDDAHTLVESRRSRIIAQEREVEVAERSVALAQVGVDNTVIRAPFAGVITVKAAQPGEMVSPISAGGGFTRTGIGTLVDMDSLEIEVEVNEAYIGRVQPEQPVETTLNAYPNWKIPGKVIAIIPAADRSKATVKVRISIENVKDPRIVPDMGVRVAFLEKPSSSTATPPLAGVLIPASALRIQGDTNLVFVVVDNHAQARKVTLGQSYSDLRQVLAGINANEPVIIKPAAELKDGDRVHVKPLQ
ncbi:MAG: efflux RND transporter periplasmic adaptor subunit [Gammaproteobacteria bacterium]|nr:efflux RND transporter periplasmic adaptor subunit [Gammaproteobacteria bacterium]